MTPSSASCRGMIGSAPGPVPTSVSGGDGDDFLRGDAGADVINGGAGSDTASFFESTAGVQIDLAAGTGRGGTAEGDSLSAVENITATQFDDTLAGNAQANLLFGAGGQDALTGGAGADTFQYGSSWDSWVDH